MTTRITIATTEGNHDVEVLVEVKAADGSWQRDDDSLVMTTGQAVARYVYDDRRIVITERK